MGEAEDAEARGRRGVVGLEGERGVDLEELAPVDEGFEVDGVEGGENFGAAAGGVEAAVKEETITGMLLRPRMPKKMALRRRMD